MANGAREGIEQRAGQAVARRSEQPRILGLIEQQEREVARALPSHLKGQAPAFLRSARTLVQQTPQLAECDPYTVIGGLMTAAQLGLQVGPLGHAYLMPRKVRGRWEAVFVLGYKGVINLAWRSGQLASISARTVHQGDEFSFDYGLLDQLVHRPNLEQQGPAYAWYSVAKFQGGGHYFNVLGRPDVEKHKKASPGADSEYSPWRKYYDEMAKKSCVHEAKPYLPLSTEVEAALENDNVVVRGESIDSLEVSEPEWIDVPAADPETGELPPAAQQPIEYAPGDEPFEAES